MRCPKCNIMRCSVVDSRMSEDNTMRRRRHKCKRGHMFTTYETYATADVWNAEKKLEKLQHGLAPLLELMNSQPRRLT